MKMEENILISRQVDRKKIFLCWSVNLLCHFRCTLGLLSGCCGLSLWIPIGSNCGLFGVTWESNWQYSVVSLEKSGGSLSGYSWITQNVLLAYFKGTLGTIFGYLLWEKFLCTLGTIQVCFRGNLGLLFRQFGRTGDICQLLQQLNRGLSNEHLEICYFFLTQSRLYLA